MNRRTYCLALGAAGFAGFSGCLSSVDGEIRPETEPDAIPSFACDDDAFEPLSGSYSEDDLHWGDTDDFSMRVNALEFTYGDTAEIELGSGLISQDRGNASQWNLELYTEQGWREVRGTTDEDDRKRLDHPSDATNADAEWRIELTEEGIVEASRHSDVLEVCPALVSGRYRFVFWGLVGAESIAVAFDIDV